MSWYVVRVAEDDLDNSALSPIGEAIKAISDGRGDVAQVSSASIEDVTGSWSDAMKAHVDALYEGLAISAFDEAGNERVIPSGNGDRIKRHLTLKLVFEEPNEMIIPIAAPQALDKGAGDPPLNMRTSYNEYLREAVFSGDARYIFETKVDAVGLTAAQKEAIMDAYDATGASGLRKGDNPPKDADTFYVQLGEYSIRQCL